MTPIVAITLVRLLNRLGLQAGGRSGRRVRLRRGVATILFGLMVAPACATSQESKLEAKLPDEVVANEADAADESISAIIAEVDSIEEAVDNSPSEADLEVLVFRTDRLLDDLVHLVAAGEESYAGFMAFGRTLALSSKFQRRGADEAALYMFGRAAALSPKEAEPHYRRGRVLLASADAKGAVKELTTAKAGTHAATFDDLDYHLALAHQLSGDVDQAAQIVGDYLTTHPDDLHARRLADMLGAESGSNGGRMRVGFEGSSLVSYAFEGPTWSIEHESLGFRIGMPLSWKIVDEDVVDGEGVLYCTAPPVIGASREWRSDSLNIWAVPVGEQSLSSLTDAYTSSLEDLSDVQERSLDGLPTGRHIQMVRTPFFEKELIGEAFIMISGKTGYVLEMWGDPSSFMQNEGQFAEILKSFVPAGQPLAKLP